MEYTDILAEWQKKREQIYNESRFGPLGPLGLSENQLAKKHNKAVSVISRAINKVKKQKYEAQVTNG